MLDVTTNNRSIQIIESKIQEKKDILVDALNLMQESIIERENKVLKTIAENEMKFNNVPAQELEFNRLQHIYGINEKFYNLLLSKKAEYSISIAGFVPQNSILETAELPKIPLSPDKNIALGIAIAMGVIAFFVLIAAKFLMFSDITTIAEVRKFTDHSVLGIVPKYKKEIPVSQLLVDKILRPQFLKPSDPSEPIFSFYRAEKRQKP